MAQKKARILLVDDHPLMRKGLALSIGERESMIVCGEAEDLAEALDGIRFKKPDLVVTDLSFRKKEVEGLNIIKNIRSQHRTIPILVLSMHSEEIYAERALKAGANGYIMKEEPTEKVLEAVETILAGGLYLSQKINEKIVKLFIKRGGDFGRGEGAVESLSDRELEVFRMIGRGFSPKQIAAELFLSVRTIGSYRERIKEKLQLDSSRELTQYAINYLKVED